jgi:hypothetical protein
MPALAGEALTLLVWATLGMLGIAALALLATWVIRDLPSWGWGSRSRKAGPGKAKPGAPDGQPDPEHGADLLPDRLLRDLLRPRRGRRGAEAEPRGEEQQGGQAFNRRPKRSDRHPATL